MKNYIQKGDTLPFTSSEAIAAGDGVIMGALFGVAATSADANVPFEASLIGVFELPKVAGAITAGAKVYWKADTSNVTTTASGNRLIGAAVSAAADAATTVVVRLNGTAV